MPNAYQNYHRNYQNPQMNNPWTNNRPSFNRSFGNYRRGNDNQMRGFQGVPLSIPKGGGGLSSLLGFKSVAKEASKLNLSKFLTSAESIVSTVNQAIPIYQQLRPIYDNSKILRNAVSGLFKEKKKGNKEYISEPEIMDPPYRESFAKNKTKEQSHLKEEKSPIINHQETPNSPFF